MWSQLNCFTLIKSGYIFHTKGWNNIKMSKEKCFSSLFESRLNMSQGKNVESSIQPFQFDDFHKLIWFHVWWKSACSSEKFSFKGTVYLAVAVLLEHWVNVPLVEQPPQSVGLIPVPINMALTPLPWGWRRSRTLHRNRLHLVLELAFIGSRAEQSRVPRLEDRQISPG